MPIYEQLWRIGKVSCASGQRRGAAVRKRGAIVITTGIVIHDAVGQRASIERPNPRYTTRRIADHSATVQHAIMRGAIAGKIKSVAADKAVIERSLVGAARIIEGVIRHDDAIGHHGIG